MEIIDQQIEKILDLQYVINELRIDYLCFDYKVIAFCAMDPHQVLSTIHSNISTLDDKDSLTQLVDQLKEFVTYYEVSDDDIEVLYENIDQLFTLFGRNTPLQLTDFMSTPPV